MLIEKTNKYFKDVLNTSDQVVIHLISCFVSF